MRKKTVLTALLALTVSSLQAEPASVAALQAYAAKALTKCPDSQISIEPINQPGPSGFIVFQVIENSSDSTCGRQTILFFSPATNQVLMGTALALPFDNRTAEARIADTAGSILKQ